ncbi:AraC family transcriptional regulator [Marinobacteraceae bacterium S3BR75-40.1]
MLNAEILRLPNTADRHHHSHYQLVIGLRGEADMDVEGTGAHLDPKHACIVPTEAAHDFCGDVLNHVLVINIDRDTPALNRSAHPGYDFLSRLFDHPRAIQFDVSLMQFIQSCCQELARVPADHPINHHLASSIVQCLGERVLKTPMPAPTRRDEMDLRRIDRYINANLHRRITVEDLAACVCMSRSQFHERFRQSQQLTPHQYLLQARLYKARELLTQTRLPLWDISHRAGFSGQSALTNAMRRYFGITPAALRRSCDQ